MRAVVADPWPARQLGEALLAIALVAAVSFSLAFAALRGRVRRV
jgi:hypothetical protein